MPQMKMMNLADIRVEDQVRKSYDPKDTEDLTASVKALGVLQPVLVMKSGKLLAGHRRFIAAKAAGLQCIPAIITDEMLTESQVKIVQLTENIQRAELTDPEIYTACQELLTLNPGWKKSDLAAHLNKDASMVTRIMSVADLIPEAKRSFMEGKFRFSKAYVISKLPPDEQPGLLALTLSGAKQEALEAAGRKVRTAAREEVKASKVKCLLPGGITVVVSGEGVSLEQAAEALADAIKEMKRARDLGYTAKTFAAAMADKAKKG